MPVAMFLTTIVAPTTALDCGSVTPPTKVAFVVWARRLEVNNRTPAAYRRVDADSLRGMQLSCWTSLRFPRQTRYAARIGWRVSQFRFGVKSFPLSLTENWKSRRN